MLKSKLNSKRKNKILLTINKSLENIKTRAYTIY